MMEMGSSPARKEEVEMARVGERGVLPKKETEEGAVVMAVIIWGDRAVELKDEVEGDGARLPLTFYVLISLVSSSLYRKIYPS
jgi:hypothetical protein